MNRPSEHPTPASGRDPSGEHALLERAVAGDRDAQQALLVEHLPRARRTIVRLVGPTSEVEDLLQSTCVEVLRSLGRFKGDASFALWMDRVAAHVVYKHFRSRSRHRRRVREAAEADAGAPPRPADPAAHTEWRRALAQLRSLLDHLNPERRIIFLLVSADGRTLEEAAAMLGISLSAAKSRYLRARRQVDRMVAAHPALAAVLRNGAGGSEVSRG
ncbi:MAG: RNA polymerase sigma factor [Myxococcota bacterium]